MKKLIHFITVLLISFILLFSCTIGLGESVDTEVPAISIVSPDPHVVYSIRGDFLIKGKWSDDGTIDSVIVTLREDKESNAKEFSFNAAFDSIENSNHIWTCVVPGVSKKIPDGSYLLSVKITDKSKHSSTATSQIIIDNTPPLIALTRPSSAASDSEIDSYGQTFTLNGEAADDSGVSSIEMNIYSSEDIENPENKLHTKTLTNVPNTIKLTLAQFKEGDETNDYYKIYKESTVKNAVDKTFYCTITAYDGAVGFPTDGSGPVKEGNSTDTYYLRDAISSILQTYKSTDLYHIIAGSYEGAAVTPDELQLDDYSVTIGKLSLNPANNPKFNISDRLKIIEDGVNSETAKIKDGESITVEVVPGLDGIAIAPETLKVFTCQCDAHGDILSGEDGAKNYPESSNPLAGGTSYKITSVIDRKNYKFNSFYRIGVEGEDIQGNPVVSYAENGYGFIFSKSGILPTLTIEKPVDGAIIKKGADVEVKGSIFYAEEGEFSIRLNDEFLFKTTKESPLAPESLKAGELSFIKDEDTEGLYNFTYIIPAGKFNQEETADYTLSFPDRDDTLEIFHGSADRTIKYDVDDPDVIINLSGSSEDNVLLGPLAFKYGEDGKRADTKEYLNSKFAFECKVSDNIGIDFVNSKIQIIEKGSNNQENIKQTLTIASQNTTFKEIDTTDFTDGNTLIIRAIIRDTAGNIKTYEVPYVVDQSTDTPLIFPVNESENATKISFALDTKAKVQAQREYNIVSADSPSIKLKLIDDDCLAGKIPVLKYSYWKADESESKALSETQKFTSNEIENIDEFSIEDAETTCYIMKFEFTDGANPDKKVIKTICIRIAPKAPSVKLENVSVEYVTNSSVVNKTETAKTSLSNKVIINSTEEPFRVSVQITKLDEEGNAQVILPFKEYDDLEEATLTSSDGTFVYETPYAIPTDYENGKYQITYKVYDKNKQTSEDSITDAVTFYVDKTSEEITDIETSTKDSVPFVAAYTKNGDAPVEFFWAFTDADSQMPSYNADAYKKTSGVNNKVKLNELFTSEGKKTVYVYAVDRAGNRSNIKSKNFIYDVSNPAAELVEKSFTSQTAFELNAKASDSWGIKKLELLQTLNNGTEEKVNEKYFDETGDLATSVNWKIENLPGTINTEFYGKYKYRIKATDLAGKETYSEPIVVTVDNKKPVCAITTENNTVLKGTLGEISGIASDGESDNEGIGMESLYYQLYRLTEDNTKTPVGNEEEIELSGALNATWKISKTLGEGNDLSEGAYCLSIYVIDLAGNKGDTKSIDFYVDFDAPVITSANAGSLVLEKNKAVYLKTDNKISITGTIKETNGIKEVTVNNQSASFVKAEQTEGDGRYTFEISGIEKPQENTDVPFTIVVTDKAEQKSESTYVIHNDTQNPTIVFSKPVVSAGGLLQGENSLYDKDFRFIGSFNDGNGSGAASYKYTITSNQLTLGEDGKYNMTGWTGSAGKDFSIAKNLSKEGENSISEGLYYLYFYVEDKVGNYSSNWISYWVDEKIPEIIDLDDINATGQNIDGIPVVNESFEITGTASDGNLIDYVEIKEGEVPVIRFENTGNAEPFDFSKTFAISGNEAVSNGKHTYTINAVDKTGRVSAPSTREVWVDTKVPEIEVKGITSPAQPAYSIGETNSIKWYKNADITLSVLAKDLNADDSGIFQVMAKADSTVDANWVMFNPAAEENIYSGVVNCSKQGVNIIRFRTIDKAGNSKETVYQVYIDTESPVSATIDTLTVGKNKITDFSNKIPVNNKNDVTVVLSAQDFYEVNDSTKSTGSGLKGITAKIGTQTISGTIVSHDSATDKWTVIIPGDKLDSGTLAFDILDNVENQVWEYTSDVIFDLDDEAPNEASINEVKNAVNKKFTLTGKAQDNNKLSSIELQYKKHTDDDTTWQSYRTIRENLTAWTIADIDTMEKVSQNELRFSNETEYDFRIIAMDIAQNITISEPETVYVNQDSDIPVLTFKDIDLTDMSSTKPAFSKNKDIHVSVFDDDGKIQSLKYRIGEGEWKTAKLSNSSYLLELEEGTYNNLDNPEINFEVVDYTGSIFTSPKLKGKDDSSTEEAVLYVLVDTTAPYIQAFNISRTGNNDEWYNATLFNEIFGGDAEHNQFYLSITVSDANSVKSVSYELRNGDEYKSCSMDSVSEPKKQNGIYYYQYKTTEPVSVEGLSSGQYSLTVTAADEGKERQTTKNLIIDNTPPEVVVQEHNNQDHIELIGSAFTLQGTFNDGDVGTTLKYQVTSSRDTSTLNADNWVDVENVSTAYWKIYFDSDKNSISGGYTHGKLPKYLLAEVFADTLKILNGKLVSKSDESLYEETPVCYFHLKGADSYGNPSITTLPLKLDPLGDIPDIYLDSPEIPLNVSVDNSKLLSGIIRLSGHVNAVNSIKRTDANQKPGIYMQIDSSFTGTFDTDWESQKLPGGKSFAEAGYSIVSFGPEDSPKRGIYIDDNLSWAFQLNKKSEFEKPNDTSTIAIRLFVVDDKGNVSRSDDTVYIIRVNAGAPKIGSSEELKLYRYGWSNSNGELVGYTKTAPGENGEPSDKELYGIDDPVCEKTSTGIWSSDYIYTPSIKDYKENMVLKGKWFLTGSVEDEDHISVFTINDTDKKTATEIEWTGEDNQKTYGYRIYYVVGDDESETYKTLSYTIVAKDGTENTLESNKNSKEETIKIIADNKSPEVDDETSENYAISKGIQNKDGFYKIKSAAKEESGESGFLRTVFFFANGTSAEGTTGSIYDSYLKSNSLNASNLKYEDGLYWKKGNVVEINKQLRQIKLESTDVNLHEGGLIKLGGLIYTVKKIENGTTLTIDGAPDLGRNVSAEDMVPVYFAIGHVVDHFGIEEAGTTKNEAGYYTDISGDDGDCMLESVNSTGTTTRWEASINSHNLNDGAIEIHYVVFDKAGNYTETVINDAVVKNNAPRLASLKLWTDYNGNGSEDSGEYKTFYNSAKTRTFKENGTEYKEERATALTENLYVTGENGAAFMTIKGEDVTFTPEVIGGNGALYYSDASDTERIPFMYGDEQIEGTDSINGSYTETDNNGQAYIKGKTMSFVLPKDKLGGNSELKQFEYWIWDSTPGLVQLNSKITVALKVIMNTSDKPTVNYAPFYWNGKDDNSLYENNRENGHIELSDALPKDTFKTGNSGIYDRDPKVSGKITVRGFVKDDIRLKQIKLRIPGFPGFDSDVLVSEYKVENGNVYWTDSCKDQIGTDHWEFNVTKDTNDGEGHKAEWELRFDTSYIEGVFKEDAQVIVKAIAGKDEGRESLETAYQMDIVPYITKVTTPLYDLVSENYRTALGHYTVRPGDELKLYGFNLEQGKNDEGTITVTVGDDWVSGKLDSVTVEGKTYHFINNLNDNDASGEYTLTDENKAILTSSDGKGVYENLYNRMPNGINNNTLNDDIYLDIWEFNPEAVKPVKGHIDQPIMKINPATGIIGFAFADGASYFSMGGKVNDTNNGNSEKDYSYNYWLGAYDSFTSIGFAYDKWGYSYGVAAGGDINDNNNPSLDRFSFMSSRWGVSGKDAGASKGNTNKHRLERIGQGAANAPVVNKQRIKSPSIATTTYDDTNKYTNVYLAYYDEINTQIRFRSGSTKKADGTEAFGMFTDDTTGNNAAKYENDTISKVNLVAGKDSKSGVAAGKYVSISVIPKDKVSGATEDIVVIVWFDEDSKTLWYGYNKTPLSSTKGKNSGSEWTISRVFSDETKSYYRAGANCQIIADENGGVHIAAYDEDNGDLVYAYTDSPYAEEVEFKTCVVDSYGVTGSNISLDIALNENGVAIPRIGYYDVANAYPKYAYLVSENTDELSGAENDMFTGNWECSIVPTESDVSVDNSKQTNLINVGVWKNNDTGVIKNSKSGTNSSVSVFDGYKSKSYGFVYGNGTKNAVLGYVIAKNSSEDFIETAQMK